MSKHDAHEDHDDGYAGPALLVTATSSHEVTALLRGYFQPVDGRYRWHGRVSGDLGGLADNRHDAVLVTPHGEALCLANDRDLWGRFAVKGSGRPPFEVEHAESLPAA